jgi:hypothetical protein
MTDSVSFVWCIDLALSVWTVTRQAVSVLENSVGILQSHGGFDKITALVVLRMAEITLVEAITCQQVIDEAGRNLADKIPTALPTFHLIVSRCLQVTPTPTAAERLPYHGLADPKGLPILVAAVREQCPMLITFNGRHFQPGHPDVQVLRPGEFIRRARYLFS